MAELSRFTFEMGGAPLFDDDVNSGVGNGEVANEGHVTGIRPMKMTS